MQKPTLRPREIHEYVEAVVGEHDHARRVLSIANGVTGVIHGAALAVHAIGSALARSAGLVTKHATKQVDRLLSNAGFDLEARFVDWVRYVVGPRLEVVVALDWTDYDADKQATVSLAMVHKGRGRATPLMWRTVFKAELKGQRSRYEDELLVRFHEAIGPGVRVTVTADRGFADQQLFSFLESLKFDYIIRIQGGTTISKTLEESRPAKRWLRSGGRLYTMREATVTHSHTPVATFVSLKRSRMKQAWYLVSSHARWSGSRIVAAYSRRFTIEEMFRDEKDPRFGLGLSATHISKPIRRDRLLFLAALARDLLTLLGQAGEAVGLDRLMKVNTVKTRTHSLFRQGCHYYGSLPNMREPDFSRLIAKFGQLLAEKQIHLSALGILEI